MEKVLEKKRYSVTLTKVNVLRFQMLRLNNEKMGTLSEELDSLLAEQLEQNEGGKQ